MEVHSTQLLHMSLYSYPIQSTILRQNLLLTAHKTHKVLLLNVNSSVTALSHCARLCALVHCACTMGYVCKLKMIDPPLCQQPVRYWSLVFGLLRRNLPLKVHHAHLRAAHRADFSVPCVDPLYNSIFFASWAITLGGGFYYYMASKLAPMCMVTRDLCP